MASVVMGGSVLFGSILSILFLLQEAQLYSGWDILFTEDSTSPKIKYSQQSRGSGSRTRKAIRFLWACSSGYRDRMRRSTAVEG